MRFNKRIFIQAVLVFSVFLIFNGQQSTAAPQGSSLNYLPIISTPAIDLNISNIIITQGIQTATNSVPLVKDRPALVRIFANTDEAAGVNNVSVTLTGSRNGTPFDTVTIGPKTVPETATEAVYNSTFNIVLPASWLSGTVTFTAVVDSTESFTEQDEGNNTFTRTKAFNNVPDLSVTVVPIDYSHQGGNDPGFYTGDRVDYISDWIRRIYPVANVNVTIRSANYPFSGNLENGSAWGTLLDNVTTLKQIDLGSVYVPELYYGFIPIKDGGDQWFFSGIAGIGWVGGGLRSSLGLNLGNNGSTGSLAGHEIGHNLGRDHAPCNVSGDPSYPYSGASIGHYGVDNIGAGSPTLLSPTGYVDMMSYCAPVWISDYTYEALYNDQLTNGRISARAQEMEDSLLIRAQIFPNGTVFVKPVYTFPQFPTPTPTQADYFVELVTASGDVVARYPVAVSEAEEDELKLRALFTAVPVPEASFDSVRIVAAETAVGQRSLTTAIGQQAILATTSQASDSATVRWGSPEISAIVRYTANNGVSWVTVGLDVLGGELEVDTTSLPGGGEGRFEVILADSAETAVVSTTLPAPLPDKEPVAWITGVTEAAQGKFTLLNGHGSDAEDGSKLSMEWFIDGELVSEQTAVSLHELSAGQHLVKLVVSDSVGQSTSAQQIITILP